MNPAIRSTRPSPTFRIATIGAAILFAGCGDDGPSGTAQLQVAGTYDSVFSTTEVTGCFGAVPTGTTAGDMIVLQAGDQVTLAISQIAPNIRTDVTGTLDRTTGVFSFEGPVQVGNDQGEVTANGTIGGSFEADGSVELVFDFSAGTACRVRGTIVGQRGV